MRVRQFVSDDDAWPVVRAKLWPHAAAELRRETGDFAAGLPLPHIAAVFTAEESGHQVGFIEIALRSYSDGCASMPVPHVEGWYVEPDARGLGIGRALMRAAETWSREHGFTELASDTEIHNDASLHAHARCGFQEVERLIKLRKRLA